MKRGNGIIGIHINSIKNLSSVTSIKGYVHTSIGKYSNGTDAYFDNIADAIYDYTYDNGYRNLGEWIEKSAKMHGK